jgi:hypothetical protein
VSKLHRSIATWRACDPHTMATKQSEAAIVFAFEAAKHDVLWLAECNQRLASALTRALDAGIDGDGVTPGPSADAIEALAHWHSK